MPLHDRVGVRELRQNLSVYLRRVKRGEALEVTERGRAVALLVPLAEEASAFQRLIEAGRARAPAHRLAELEPAAGKPTRKLSRALEEERSES
jgi:prevent-host-death family protein